MSTAAAPCNSASAFLSRGIHVFGYREHFNDAAVCLGTREGPAILSLWLTAAEARDLATALGKMADFADKPDLSGIMDGAAMMPIAAESC